MGGGKQVRIHYLQHVPFEGPAQIGEWADKRGFPLTGTFFFRKGNLPDQDDFDFLIVMGGPMGTEDVERFPWLPVEKEFIGKSIEKGKRVVGICLGAQLIAHALGAEVYPNRCKEIGWFPVTLNERGKESPLFRGTNHTFTPFHWHGDTFDIPKGAIHIAESEGCRNQAFLFDNRVLGLQFHLETTEEAAKRLISHCEDEIVKGPFTQQREEMLESPQRFEEIRSILFRVLDNMAGRK